MVADYFFLVRGEEQFLGKMGRIGKIKTIKTIRTDKTDRTIRTFVRDRLNRPKVLIVLTSLTSHPKLSLPLCTFRKFCYLCPIYVRTRTPYTHKTLMIKHLAICLPN